MKVEDDSKLLPNILTKHPLCPFLLSMNSCPHEVLFALAQVSPSFVLSWHEYYTSVSAYDGKRMRLQKNL